jgi:hypothetical protein
MRCPAHSIPDHYLGNVLTRWFPCKSEHGLSPLAHFDLRCVSLVRPDRRTDPTNVESATLLLGRSLPFDFGDLESEPSCAGMMQEVGSTSIRQALVGWTSAPHQAKFHVKVQTAVMGFDYLHL